MINNQAYIFAVFTINGIIIGLLFDIFRILRKTFKTSDLITSIEDIIFWIMVGFLMIYSMYNYCDGELRFFMIIGIIVGVIMYIVLISRYIIITFLKFINIVKKVKKIGDFLYKRRNI